MDYLFLYHGLCLFVLALTYFGSKTKGEKMTGSLLSVYIAIALVITSDTVYSILVYFNVTNSFVLYLVNIIYFVASIVGVYSWARFTIKTLNSIIYTSPFYSFAFFVPVAADILLAVTTPFTGYIFTVTNGQYAHGNLFALDTIIKLFYLLFASAISFAFARKEQRKYLHKRFLLLGSYCIPVILSGVLQSTTGLDFNCVSSVVGIAIVYKFGLSNTAKDNAGLLSAIAGSYVASFMVNTDDHSVKTLSLDEVYRNLDIIKSNANYENCVRNFILYYVVPEDRFATERDFAIDNVLKHLETNNTYSIIFKSTLSTDGYDKVTFMKAYSDEDRHELFIGIEKVETRLILLQEKERLETEKEEFERVKEYFTNVIANIIEARDYNSGVHVMRVKEFTQILCDEIMERYPEYGLTPVISRYIISGSALHDIGKIMIPDSVLLKTGKLNAEELEIMRTHCVKGCTILDKLPQDLDYDYTNYAREICHWHHERYDGSGYPDGLVGDETPLAAQITAITDCFDALTAKRPYKDPIPPGVAMQMLFDGKCGMLNPKLLECFRDAYEKNEASFL